MKHYIILFAALVLCAASMTAQTKRSAKILNQKVAVENIKTIRADNQFFISMDLCLDELDMPANRRVVLTPTIMSGDNSTEHYNECAAMKRYAISQGVPSEDIFCDHAGFSTYESMYRAKNVFGCSRVVVATQTYHLYRALYSAHALGVDAIGVASDYRSYGKQTWYDVREIPARTKDFFKSLFDVPSTFVGEPISLDQSGDVTG